MMLSTQEKVFCDFEFSVTVQPETFALNMEIIHLREVVLLIGCCSFGDSKRVYALVKVQTVQKHYKRHCIEFKQSTLAVQKCCQHRLVYNYRYHNLVCGVA